MRGIRRHGSGWQASVYVAGQPRAYQPFPVDTPLAEMQAWRESQRARMIVQRGTEVVIGRIPAGTFAADAQRYLKAVKALRDFKGRAYDIQLWVDVFGTKRTLTIRPHEIRTQRDRWLTVGPKRVYNKKVREWEDKSIPLAASTVNHRLRALENLYTVLYPQGYNPVRDVPEAVEPRPEDRSISYETLELILAALPDRGQPVKNDKRSTVSKSKARLRLMAYTGLTHSQMMALTPGDLDATIPAVRVEQRRKGKGAGGGWLPLPLDAIPAIQGFIAAGAFGPFSRHSLRKTWLRACQNANQPACRVYDLRHSYATRVLETTQDLKVTQHLLNHGSSKTTERYASRAIPAWLAAGARSVSLAQSFGTVGTGNQRKTPETSGRKRKRS